MAALIRDVYRENPWLSSILLVAAAVVTFLLGGIWWTAGLIGLLIVMLIAALVNSLVRTRAALNAPRRTGPPTDPDVESTESSGREAESVGMVDDAPVPSLKDSAPERASIDTTDGESAIIVAIRASIARNPHEVDRVLRPWIAEVASNPSELLRRTSVKLQFMAEAGDAEALAHLEQLADQHPSDAAPAQFLAMALETIGEGTRAANELAARRSRLADEGAARSFVLQEARLRRLAGHPLDSLSLTDELLDRVEALTPAAVAEAYAERGYALESLDRKVEAVAAFERALQSDPLKEEVRFRAGYICSELGLHGVAVTHYGVLVDSETKQLYARNNLGAELHELGLPILGTSEYLVAAGAGIGLSSANLARLLASVGFRDEAMKLIDDARRADTPHASVDHVAANTRQSEEQEEEKLREIKRTADDVRTMLSHLSAREPSVLPAGQWTIGNIGFDLRISDAEAKGSFGKEPAKVDLSVRVQASSNLLAITIRTGMFGLTKAEGFVACDGTTMFGFVKGWPLANQVNVISAVRAP